MRRPSPARRRSSAGCCGWNRRDGPFRLRIRRSTRNRMVVAAIALVCAAASVSPVARPIRGLSLDILTALRWEMFGRSHDPAASPAVVVAIDEESLRTAPFKGSPMLTWTGEIGRVLAATLGRRRQGGRLRRGDSEFARAIRDTVWQTACWAKRSAVSTATFCVRLPERPPTARWCWAKFSAAADHAIARTARRGTPAAEYPAAQRPYRQRRYRAPTAADLCHRRRESADHGGRAGVTGAGRPRLNSTSAAG